jgi:type IV pilus assembly protein PilM
VILRTYLGLDVGPKELRAVALRRRGKGLSLTGGRILPLAEGIMASSVREPNIIDRQRFAAGIHEILGPLAGREERIALSLSETAGRVLLTEVENVFKSKAEGMEILKWQLKNSLPLEPGAVQLDYQILEKRDTGRCRLVVALMAKKVLNQYEEILAEAGFNASVVDFHSLSLYNYYRPRLDLGEDFVLVAIEDDFLSFQFFQAHILTFHRAKKVEPSPALVFQEINRSLVGCRENYPRFQRAAVFLHSNWEDREPLLEALRTAFEREVILLDPHLERLASAPLKLSTGQSRGLVAAVGVAERLT